MIYYKYKQNKKALTASEQEALKDGERLPLSIKDMGACDIYPQTISHNPNGRFVVVCGDGEYIIYTSMALRNKAYGPAQEFIWSGVDSSEYAIRDGSQVKIFKNFKERKSFKPRFLIYRFETNIFSSVKFSVGITRRLYLKLYQIKSLLEFTDIYIDQI